MDNFFHNLINEEIAISVDKMYEVSRIINARGLSTKVCLFPFISLFAVKIDELAQAEHHMKHSCPHNEKMKAQELESCNVKVSLCVAVLVNFFYPIIEQLEKIVDDGIRLEKENK
jgi:hypothetical protein